MLQSPDRANSKRPYLDSELLALLKLVESRRVLEIEAAARRVIAQRGKNSLAVKALSFALLGQLKYSEALPILRAAVVDFPSDPELHNNLGIALSSLMFWQEATLAFEAALRLTPEDPEILKNMGVACIRMNRWGEAVPWFLKAIEYFDGDFVEAVELLATSLLNANRNEEAVICYRELIANDPANPGRLYQYITAMLRLCDWQSLEGSIHSLRKLAADFSVEVGPPFYALSITGLTSREHLAVAKTFVARMVPPHLLERPKGPTVVSPATRRTKLRIGYLSADYKQHPVGLVIPEVIESHDRRRVEVFGYSMGKDDGSAIRRRLEQAFDQFIDVALLSVHETAERIRADGVDILIDLQGWTSEGRPESLALRCAPVQVNWLGYAGTLGHSNLADYLLGDRTVTPLEAAADYTETLALLPNCYLPFDSKRPDIASPSRVEAGLPDDSFVFVSHNNIYKINPQVFDLWGEILKAVPDSVLWLSRPGAESTRARLYEEMERRGLAAERLVLAPRVDSHDHHLARLALADLALDPFPYNSHSSGADVLWSGVPMVSLLGDTFPARVGASLLRAAGLDQCVVTSVQDYQRLAIALASDRPRLQAMRDRLRAGRRDLPLFNMKALAKSMEDIFFRMWEQHLAGRKEAIV